MTAMAEDAPPPDDDDTDLRPKTFLEKNGFKLILVAVVFTMLAAGLLFG